MSLSLTTRADSTKVPTFAGRCPAQGFPGYANRAAHTARNLEIYRSLSPLAQARVRSRRADSLLFLLLLLLVVAGFWGCTAAHTAPPEARDYRYEHNSDTRGWHEVDTLRD